MIPMSLSRRKQCILHGKPQDYRFFLSCAAVDRYIWKFKNLLYTTRIFSFSRPILLLQFGRSLSPSPRWNVQRLLLTGNSRRFSVGEDGCRYLGLEISNFRSGGFYDRDAVRFKDLASLHRQIQDCWSVPCHRSPFIVGNRPRVGDGDA